MIANKIIPDQESKANLLFAKRVQNESPYTQENMKIIKMDTNSRYLEAYLGGRDLGTNHNIRLLGQGFSHKHTYHNYFVISKQQS